MVCDTVYVVSSYNSRTGESTISSVRYNREDAEEDVKVINEGTNRYNHSFHGRIEEFEIT